jgi:integrase
MARGDGRIFKRGETWWYAVYMGGLEIRRSTKKRGEQGEKWARTLLRRALAEIDAGTHLGPKADRLTVRAVLAGYLDDLRLRGKKDVPKCVVRFARIARELGDERAAMLSASRLQRWMQGQLEDGAARATVKLQADYLKAALRWAYRTQQIARVPYVPSLRVDNARQGFFEADQVDALLAELPEAYHDIVRFAALTGWRSNEYLGLTWDRVNRTAGEIRLATSKNGQGRVVPIVAGLVDIVARRWAARRVWTAKGPTLATHVFHVDGQPIRYWRWLRRFTAAAEAAGLDRLPHDFRRTAVRNLVAAGVPERVAMAVTGHRSRAVFDRYTIVATADMADALAKADRRRPLAQ